MLIFRWLRVSELIHEIERSVPHEKATILFGSTTGNTEIVADKIAENMPDYTVQVIYVTDAKDDAAVQEADLVIYGCSTMGLGELQEDFLPTTRIG